MRGAPYKVGTVQKFIGEKKKGEEGELCLRQRVSITLVLSAALSWGLLPPHYVARTPRRGALRL